MATVAGKSLGRKKPLFADFAVEVPPGWQGDVGATLRELVAFIVRQQVTRFKDRQQERQFLRALTEREIAEGAAKGKIEMGASEVEPQHVDEESAVATAWEAFEDGLYFIIIDGQQYEKLDQPINIESDSQITFVRLTMLAGG